MNKDLFCKGYTWGFFSGSGAFQTPEAERSMELLAANGLNWICIPVNFSGNLLFAQRVLAFRQNSNRRRRYLRDKES